MLCVHFSNEKHSSVKRKEWILLQGFVDVCHKWAVNVWAYGACFGGSFSLSPRLFYFLLNYTKLSSWCIVHWLDRNAWQYVKFANEGERIAFKQSVSASSSRFISSSLHRLSALLPWTHAGNHKQHAGISAARGDPTPDRKWFGRTWQSCAPDGTHWRTRVNLPAWVRNHLSDLSAREREIPILCLLLMLGTLWLGYTLYLIKRR